MHSLTKIFVAGHRGLVGSALVKVLTEAGYSQLICKTHQECDLANPQEVEMLFAKESPEVVIVAAAKVGGIGANNRLPVDFLLANSRIALNVIDAAARHQTKKLIFLGSSCIYPKYCPQPMQESHLLSGELEQTNRPYALAKILGIELCAAYNRQYHTNFLAVMPTNLYGPLDNYSLSDSHVIPALIHKIHLAQINGEKFVPLWGTGTPLREFLYSTDLAKACLNLLEQPEHIFKNLCHPQDLSFPLLNIGSGEECSIASIAKKIAELIGYQGKIMFDPAHPDGAPRKLLDSNRLRSLGWQPEVSLELGLKLAYQDFLQRQIATTVRQNNPQIEIAT